MANEIYTGDSGQGAAVIAGTLARRVALAKLGDRESFRNHPALVLIDDPLRGMGGAALKGALHGFGLDTMASRTEIQAIANTAPSSANYTVTPGRFGLRYEVGDWQRTIDPTGIHEPASIAQWMPVSYGITLATEIAKLGDDLTNVGTTTVDFSHDVFLLGQFALEAAGVGGPYLAVMSGNSYTDWQRDLEQRGGMTQFQAATAAQLQIRGPGFKGSYQGVDIFMSSYVQTINSAADDANFIFGRGCFGLKEVPMAAPSRSSFVLMDLGFIRVEESRSADTGLTAVTATSHFGTVTMEGGRGRAFSGAV